MIEAPLLLRLQDFENRHDAIFSYIFSVYTAAQKQFFFDCSTAMAVFPPAMNEEAAPSVPLILNHGSRSDIDEVKSAIQRQNQAAAAQQAQQEKQAQQGKKAQPMADARLSAKPINVDEAVKSTAAEQPVEPTQPAQPAEPAQSEQPVDPMQSMEPMEPMQPMQPMEPINMADVFPTIPQEPMTAPKDEKKEEPAMTFDFSFPLEPTNTPASTTNEQPASAAGEEDLLSGF